MYLTVWLISPEMKQINTNFSIFCSVKNVFINPHTPNFSWVVSYHYTVRFCKNHPTTPIIVHIAFQYYCNSLFSPLRPMGLLGVWVMSLSALLKRPAQKFHLCVVFNSFLQKKEKHCCCCLCTTETQLFLKKSHASLLSLSFIHRKKLKCISILL